LGLFFGQAGSNRVIFNSKCCGAQNHIALRHIFLFFHCLTGVMPTATVPVAKGELGQKDHEFYQASLTGIQGIKGAARKEAAPK